MQQLLHPKSPEKIKIFTQTALSELEPERLSEQRRDQEREQLLAFLEPRRLRRGEPRLSAYEVAVIDQIRDMHDVKEGTR